MAGCVTLLALATAPGSGAEDLIQIDIPSLAISASSNDFKSLGQDFLLQEGDFSGLIGQSAYTATLRYLEMDSALVLAVTGFGSDATLTIPSTGLVVAFNAVSPDDLENQIEDYLQDTGAKEWARFLEQTNAHSKLALLDGNPRATTALLSSGAFRRFGLGASRSRLGYREEEVGRWGAFQLRAEGGGGVVDVDHFDDLYTAEGSLTLAGHFGRYVGLSLAMMGGYRSYQTADSWDAGIELGLPITILRPDEGSSLYWAITPFVQSAAAASIDLAAGGLLLGGGGVNTLALELGIFELTLANQLAYYGGLPIDEIQGYDFDTQLDQLILKNGLKAGVHLGIFYLDAGSAFTNFLTSDAAVDFYATPFVGVGLALGRWANLRVGYEADLGSGYTAQSGTLKLDFHF
ncbi:MAG: hypothetical protein ACHQ3O_08770 [Candidatus Limnocylindria bacterium]|jgi:hypothetical protein